MSSLDKAVLEFKKAVSSSYYDLNNVASRLRADQVDAFHQEARKIDRRYADVERTIRYIGA